MAAPEVFAWEGDIQVFDGVAAAARGDAILILWRTPARRERILRAVGWIDALLARSPDTVVVCQLLLSSASPPNREGRTVAKPEALRLAARVRRAVMVPLGDSAWQAIVRAILRAGVMIAGHASQLKIASNERQAVDSILEVATPRSASRAELDAAVGALYVAVGLTPPPARS